MVTGKILQQFYTRIEEVFKANELLAGKSGRHMKFPYTISAKISQFPIFMYFKYNPVWMYWPLGWIGSLYVFVKIHNLANSEQNKKSWRETQAKNAAKEHSH